jgi:outer membrane receptor protein involved in Fe transport
LRPILTKRNIGKVEIYGAELGFNWDVAPNAQVKLSWGHFYSNILEFERLDPNNETSLVGMELTNQPRNVFNALFSWRNKIVNSSINFHFKDSQWLNDENTQEIEGFYFVDLQLWRPIYQGLNISLMVSNLLDNKYIDSRNMISPGRMISLKLGYSL